MKGVVRQRDEQRRLEVKESGEEIVHLESSFRYGVGVLTQRSRIRSRPLHFMRRGTLLA
jgi:hypothetical protein